MLRFRDSALLLGSALLLWLPMQGQNAARPTNKNAAAQGTVRHVSVRGPETSLEIEIDTTGTPASPDTQAIADPDRIVIDFPGALPAAELRALEVNRGALKRIRTGLFFSNPPITRVVLDLTGPRSYRVMSSVNAVIVKLEATSAATDVAAAAPSSQGRGSGYSSAATLQNATAVANPYALPTVSSAAMQSMPAAIVNPVRANVAPSAAPGVVTNSAPSFTPNSVPNVVASTTAVSQLDGMPSLLPQNQLQQDQARAAALAGVPLLVSYVDGLLTIHAVKATLAQVLFEVQRQTKADIAIPAGAEQEGVVAEIGPGAARDVLATLLNGSHYNFIFVGEEGRLERVILTQREFTN